MTVDLLISLKKLSLALPFPLKQANPRFVIAPVLFFTQMTLRLCVGMVVVVVGDGGYCVGLVR